MVGVEDRGLLDGQAFSIDRACCTLVNDRMVAVGPGQQSRPWGFLKEFAGKWLLVDIEPMFITLFDGHSAAETAVWNRVCIAGGPRIGVDRLIQMPPRAKRFARGSHDRHQRVVLVNVPHDFILTLMGFEVTSEGDVKVGAVC